MRNAGTNSDSLSSLDQSLLEIWGMDVHGHFPQWLEQNPPPSVIAIRDRWLRSNAATPHPSTELEPAQFGVRRRIAADIAASDLIRAGIFGLIIGAIAVTAATATVFIR